MVQGSNPTSIAVAYWTHICAMSGPVMGMVLSGCALGLQEILGGFDLHEVDAAIEQPANLLGEPATLLIETDVAE